MFNFILGKNKQIKKEHLKLKKQVNINQLGGKEKLHMK